VGAAGEVWGDHKGSKGEVIGVGVRGLQGRLFGKGQSPLGLRRDIMARVF